MESKLNALAIETYNTAFSNRVINDFYARHEKINGEQILQLSPVPQVNLFVIKNLFNTWQKEAASMRSPYFNYQHPKVQEAQKVYMNTLSRHIAVDEAKLKPLLLQAVQETLILIFTPILHIQKALQASSGSPQEVSETLRYVKINQAYAQEAKNIINQQDITDDQWLKNLVEELQRLEAAGRLQPESPTRYMEQFSQVLPLKPSEVLKDEELEAAEDDDNTDFFSSLSGRLEKEEQQHLKQAKDTEEQKHIENQKRAEEQRRREEQEYLEEQKYREEQKRREEEEYFEAQKRKEEQKRRREEQEYLEKQKLREEQQRREEEEYIKAQKLREEQKRRAEEQEYIEEQNRREEQKQDNTHIQQTQAAPSPDEDIPTVTETAPRHAQLRREEPELTNSTPNIRISRPEGNEERNNKTLNEKFGREYQSLNDRLTAPAVEKKHGIPLQQIKKAGNIRSGISLNQRFMFTNELFGGDSNAFNQALDELDGFENYQEAHQYSLRQYARTYDWDLDGEASQEFMEILQSRYGG